MISISLKINTITNKCSKTSLKEYSMIILDIKFDFDYLTHTYLETIGHVSEIPVFGVTPLSICAKAYIEYSVWFNAGISDVRKIGYIPIPQFFIIASIL